MWDPKKHAGLSKKQNQPDNPKKNALRCKKNTDGRLSNVYDGILKEKHAWQKFVQNSEDQLMLSSG